MSNEDNQGSGAHSDLADAHAAPFLAAGQGVGYGGPCTVDPTGELKQSGRGTAWTEAKQQSGGVEEPMRRYLVPLRDQTSQERKETPVFSGLLMYFPDACAAVARLSYTANEKHNPGEPMHWSKGKSNDHADCVVRHLMDMYDTDEFGELEATAAAWRALANLQTIIEEMREHG